MRKLRFSEQEIVSILREPELGGTVEQVCRKAGIARQTYYRWRTKYAGLLPSEIRRIRTLEDENVRLRRMLAVMVVDSDFLRQVLQEKVRKADPRAAHRLEGQGVGF
jgi:putative transposase